MKKSFAPEQTGNEMKRGGSESLRQTQTLNTETEVTALSERQ